ncbi:MFS transporter [Cohnella thailandensis]|uniref:MFS transporter n=1 Tax=Cohnella thailandensis TaxID=557557 RepID=A0A841SVH7_9BACL|nr:MFS transporter [Cohnella thailandensis]MBB6634075.1 MFS transporter [Cohnella thailandensis]MBP1972433.1 DHA2 family metal-tetracycline-proton antiporter-like MFS transporter [Cohnella thailandensis]
MTTEASSATIGSLEETRVREGLLISLLGLAMILVIMNTTMFNLALPSVSAEYGLSASATSWIVTGYSIVFAISSITYSRLSDSVPIRRLLVIGLTSIGAAAVVGLFSGSFIMLLIVRLVQATGAGAAPALSLVLISRYIPQERQGKATALVMSATSLALGLGPVAGGAIVEYLGWHYLFVVTAIALLLVPLFAAVVPKERPKPASFDAWGAAYVAIGTTGLLFALTNRSFLALALGLAGVALFALRIRRAKDPFVQPALFRDRSYLIVGAVGIGAYICSFATLYLMPQMLSHLFGLSAVSAGLVIFPGSVLAMIVSRVVGRIIDGSGNRGIIRYVPPAVFVSMILFALFSHTSYVAIIFIYMILSVGFTFLTSSISNEISRLLPASRIGSGLGLFQLLQFISGAFGVAMTASALSWQKGMEESVAYSNIYWGLAVIALLAVGGSSLYLRKSGRR